MDCIKPQSNNNNNNHHHPNPNKPHKFSFPFSRCIHPQTPTSRFSPNSKTSDFNHFLKQSILTRQKSHKSNPDQDYAPSSAHHHNNAHRAAKEALLAKLFASVSSIKAAYAELQSAQCPYDSAAVQSADRQVVAELVVLSELKHKFITRTLDLPPPHVANLLAEIQEQQSNIKTYEISTKQMESKIVQQNSQISAMRKDLERLLQGNRSREKRLNSSGSLILPAHAHAHVSLSDLNHTHFIRSLQLLMRSVRNFVKHLVREMEAKGWDLDLAAKAAVFAAGANNEIRFSHPKHKAFAFESYLCCVLFDGFNHRDFLLPAANHTSSSSSSSTSSSTTGDSDRSGARPRRPESFFDECLRLQSETASQILIEDPQGGFARFCRSKYLKLVQPKMECSFFGNLDQRKLMLSSVAFPGGDFFSAFAEAAKTVWLLHCLAFSFDPPVVAFQVKRGCRFSEVYMESVAGDVDSAGGRLGCTGEVLVAFTVVPGFKIGKTVVQSQVYLTSQPENR